MKWEDLLFSTVQIGLTVSAVALIPLLLRKVLKKRYPARVMCLVWALLAVRLLVPVQITLPEPPVQVTPRTYYVLNDVRPSAETGQQTSLVDPADTRWVTGRQAAQLDADYPNNPASVTTVDVSGLLAGLWLLGVFCFAAAQLELYLRYSRRLRRYARSAQSAALCRAFDEQKQALSIRSAIPLRVSPAADCPMLAGFFRPALYLPDEQLSEEEAAFIFRHELTHYRHGDLWLKLLLVLARAVQWFNPLVHLMARFAYEDIELACDDTVAKNMDGTERRAYGETILRSAVVRAKKRALVSCFNGDKETLMRRFEGLFDKHAKKRGVALVLMVAVLVGTLGCAFSVGTDDGQLTDAELTALGEQWMRGNYRDAEPWHDMLTEPLAKKLYDQRVAAGEEIGEAGGATPGEPLWRIGASSPYVDAYAVLPDAANRQAVIVTKWVAAGEETGRSAERIHFKRENGEWKVDKVEGNLYINDTAFVNKADSLAHFRVLYENDLGLPAQGILSYLEGGKAETVREWDVTGDGENDMAETRYTFADGSVLTLTNGQDWTDENGENDRTAADLAQQYARAVYYKSVWPLYPVLSESGQQALADHQRSIAGSEPGGVWYTKFGGSSPSYRNFVIVPSGEPDSAIVVFQEYGGGTTDVRSANKVVIGKENSRSVITGFAEYDTWQSWMLTEMKPQKAELTKRELFELYYTTGLPWPDLVYGNSGERVTSSFNGVSLTALLQPVSAAETVFNYFGEQVEHVEGTYHEMRTESWFAGIELLSQTGAEAVVRLTFTDGSTPVDVQMRRDGDYWLPAGLAAHTEGQPEDVQAVDAVRAIDSATYTNPVYGYTLTLPDSFVGDGYIDERDPANVIFGLRFASGDDPESEFQYGTVMNITMDLTALFKQNFGENWTAGFPVPCVELAQRDGLVWYAALASDVQYDPSDAAKAEAYQKLYADANALSGNALSFSGQTEVQRQDCAALRLQKQGEAYAYSRSGTGDGPYLNSCDVTPQSADGSCTVRVEWSNLKGDSFFHTVERVWFADENALTPSRTEPLLNTSDGVRSLADFQLLYQNGAGFPVLSMEALEALSGTAAKPASLDNPDLSTPEACAAYMLHLAGGSLENRRIHPITNQQSITYRWADGSINLMMQQIRLSEDSAALWLPIGWWDGGDDSASLQSPYDEVLAHAIQHYPDRTTEELFSYLAGGYADGAYAEGIYAELDRRWQADPAVVENAAAAYGDDLREQWRRHKEKTPEIFPQ